MYEIHAFNTENYQISGIGAKKWGSADPAILIIRHTYLLFRYNSHHHHHHSFLKRPFVPYQARVRRLPHEWSPTHSWTTPPIQAATQATACHLSHTPQVFLAPSMKLHTRHIWLSSRAVTEAWEDITVRIKRDVCNHTWYNFSCWASLSSSTFFAFSTTCCSSWGPFSSTDITALGMCARFTKQTR